MRDGRAVGSGVPRPCDAVSGDFVSVWPVAYLSGDFRRTHPLLPHIRRLRLLTVLPLCHSSSRFDYVRRPNFVLFVCFIGGVLGLCVAPRGPMLFSPWSISSATDPIPFYRFGDQNCIVPWLIIFDWELVFIG